MLTFRLLNKLKEVVAEVLGPIYPAAFSSPRRYKLWLKRLALLTIERNNEVWVQVGANNGGNWDPVSCTLRENPLPVLLIEPVDYLMSKLRNAYKDYSAPVIFEQSAISKHDGNIILNIIREESLNGIPGWARGLSSIDKNVILSHHDAIPDLKYRLKEVRVPTCSLSYLFTKHKIQRVTFLQIDTEGHDDIVINTIDFSEVEIGLIQFEHKHLSSGSYHRTLSYLKGKGYMIHRMVGDTLAWHKSRPDIGFLISKYLWNS